MNRLLIGTLDITNKIIALLLIVFGMIEGWYGDVWPYIGQGYVEARSILGAIIGLVVGLVLAGLVSGFLAAIITIARELISIHELLAVRVWTPPPPR
ncbi:MAG TPA: hypothetical protein VF930_06140 [Stellaceae bacterium]